LHSLKLKKVLIITYYWPPSGGAGVQRWVKFVKYLCEFGWEPVVYTPSNPENPVEDNSLFKDIPANIEVIKTPIWEPYDLYKSFVGRKKEEKINTGFLSEKKKTGFTEKISVWMRGNFFIPDARKFWIRPSIKFLSNYLSKNKIDFIVSTGPPHSMHLIALGLKNKFNIPWLADFRDPWTNIDYYHDLMLSKEADKKHHKLEAEVLTKADLVVSVGKTMNDEFIITQISSQNFSKDKFHVITNGYDEDDLTKDKIIPDKNFSISHIGTLVKSRNPEALWRAISDLVKSNADFQTDLEIKLVGKVDASVIALIKKYELKKYLNKIEYLNHDEVIKMQNQSQVLLLILNNTINAKGILTGKFFEYLAAKRPILCIGPTNGDVAKIIDETNAGVVIDFEDFEKMKIELLSLYQKFQSKNLNSEIKNIEQYSRRNLTKKLSKLLDAKM
jgi:glycosyltransferase involved in cell wall biosynthesis